MNFGVVHLVFDYNSALELLQGFQRDEAMRLARAERYALQSVAKEILPNERVSICLRNRTGNYVQVHQHLKTQKAFYSGLMICASVWNCPVCAAKISEKRKKELTQAINAHKASSGQLAMLTLTVSHKRSDDLEKLLEAFNSATTQLFGGKAFNQLRQDMGIVGRVKALEVTHGANGWHPHAHIVLFYEQEVDLEQVRKKMYRLWSNACVKYKLKTSEKYGLDLQGADQVQAYLTKHGSWGIEQELTKSHVKRGREGSMTPFDLLRDVLTNDDEIARALFSEYASVFKGRRQLHWSRGLKEHFLIEDKTDDEVAKSKIEQADVLGNLDALTWRYLYKNNLRAQFLDDCELYGFVGAIDKLGL